MNPYNVKEMEDFLLNFVFPELSNTESGIIGFCFLFFLCLYFSDKQIKREEKEKEEKKLKRQQLKSAG